MSIGQVSGTQYVHRETSFKLFIDRTNIIFGFILIDLYLKVSSKFNYKIAININQVMGIPSTNTYLVVLSFI